MQGTSVLRAAPKTMQTRRSSLGARCVGPQDDGTFKINNNTWTLFSLTYSSFSLQQAAPEIPQLDSALDAKDTVHRWRDHS